MKNIYFQSSLPRAGSTLLQNILAQNPYIYATPTSGVLELLYGARKNFSISPEFKAQDSHLMNIGFTAFCRSALLGFYDAITNKQHVIDKSRGWGIHYDFINAFYPNPKIVCMIRDIPDIFASMEKRFRANQHLDYGITKSINLSGITTAERIEIWEKTPPVGLALARLQEIIRQGIATKMLFIKYEDLTRDPRTEMQKIYKFLEIPFFEHNFEYVEQVTKEDDAVYGIYGDHTIENKVTCKPSRAREILGNDVCEKLRAKYKWFYDYFTF